MFRVASLYISELSPGKAYSNEEELAREWSNHLEANDRKVRNDFYAHVTKANHRNTSDSS